MRSSIDRRVVREQDVRVEPSDDFRLPSDAVVSEVSSRPANQVRWQRIHYGLRTWFRTPPRRHGEIVAEREVSFLELFYDLVYVVLIGRATHHLAGHITGRGIVEFAVVFGLIWLAWFNGTFWHELHGREDGRSRNYIFLQMGLLALLAVFAGEAAGEDGAAFAITYSMLFALLTWQWWQVHRIDTDPRYRPTTMRYIGGMLASTAVILASAFADDSWRVALWALVVTGWVVGGHALVSRDHTEGFGEGVTESLVERMGLFTIIVLGEMVVGVVLGMSDAEHRDTATIATGMIGLMVGMGIWWNYFDMLGRRVPRRRGRRLANWLYAHLPLTMAIAAAGAALVSIVGHASDRSVAPSTGWLFTGSIAVTLAAVGIACTALPADEFPSGMRRWIAPTFAIAAAIPIAIAAFESPPIVLVSGTAAALLLAWLVLFAVFLACGGDPEVVGFQLGHDQVSHSGRDPDEAN
jgi:low temperature requirement protein LtrA